MQISRIVKTYDAFGARFVRRVFTDHEAEYAVGSPAIAPQTSARRLATRFAAKEAAKKILRSHGIGWREIEVRRRDNGACDIALYGAALRCRGGDRRARLCVIVEPRRGLRDRGCRREPHAPV